MASPIHRSFLDERAPPGPSPPSFKHSRTPTPNAGLALNPTIITGGIIPECPLASDSYLRPRTRRPVAERWLRGNFDRRATRSLPLAADEATLAHSRPRSIPARHPKASLAPVVSSALTVRHELLPSIQAAEYRRAATRPQDLPSPFGCGVVQAALNWTFAVGSPDLFECFMSDEARHYWLTPLNSRGSVSFDLACPKPPASPWC